MQLKIPSKQSESAASLSLLLSPSVILCNLVSASAFEVKLLCETCSHLLLAQSEASCVSVRFPAFDLPRDLFPCLLWCTARALVLWHFGDAFLSLHLSHSLRSVPCRVLEGTLHTLSPSPHRLLIPQVFSPRISAFLSVTDIPSLLVIFSSTSSTSSKSVTDLESLPRAPPSLQTQNPGNRICQSSFTKQLLPKMYLCPQGILVPWSPHSPSSLSLSSVSLDVWVVTFHYPLLSWPLVSFTMSVTWFTIPHGAPLK